jgi:ribosome-binding protein aMBF1 (putative translation factor)
MSEIMVDALREGEIVTVPEALALEEDLFILRRHEVVSSKILVSESPKRNTSKPIGWKSYEPEYKKNYVIKELIDNFHWEIIKARKARNLSRKQMGDSIGVSEPNLRLVEHGELPSDDFVLINKIQSFLKINLRRDGKSFSDVSVKELSTPSEVTLASLQRMKEREEKQRAENEPSKDEEIEIIE